MFPWSAFTPNTIIFSIGLISHKIAWNFPCKSIQIIIMSNAVTITIIGLRRIFSSLEPLRWLAIVSILPVYYDRGDRQCSIVETTWSLWVIARASRQFVCGGYEKSPNLMNYSVTRRCSWNGKFYSCKETSRRLSIIGGLHQATCSLVFTDLSLEMVGLTFPLENKC